MDVGNANLNANKAHQPSVPFRDPKIHLSHPSRLTNSSSSDRRLLLGLSGFRLYLYATTPAANFDFSGGRSNTSPASSRVCKDIFVTVRGGVTDADGGFTLGTGRGKVA